MIAYLFRKYENVAFQLFVILQQFTCEVCSFLKKQPQFLLSFLFINKTLWFLYDNGLRHERVKNTRAPVNAKISLLFMLKQYIFIKFAWLNLQCLFLSTSGAFFDFAFCFKLNKISKDHIFQLHQCKGGVKICAFV